MKSRGRELAMASSSLIAALFKISAVAFNTVACRVKEFWDSKSHTFSPGSTGIIAKHF